MLIDFPPGIVNETSRRRNKVNWREGHLVRWEGNTLMPIGGWQKLAYSGEFASPLRSIHRWVDNSGIRHIAYLCEQHCYVDSGDSVLKDITPEDGIEPPPRPPTKVDMATMCTILRITANHEQPPTVS